MTRRRTADRDVRPIEKRLGRHRMGIRQTAGRKALDESEAGVDDEEGLAGRILPGCEEVLVVAGVEPDLVAATVVDEREQHGPVPLVDDRGVGGRRADVAPEPDLMARPDRQTLRARTAGARND